MDRLMPTRRSNSGSFSSATTVCPRVASTTVFTTSPRGTLMRSLLIPHLYLFCAAWSFVFTVRFVLPFFLHFTFLVLPIRRRHVRDKEFNCANNCVMKYLKINQRITQRFQEIQVMANENVLAAIQKGNPQSWQYWTSLFVFSFSPFLNVFFSWVLVGNRCNWAPACCCDLCRTGRMTDRERMVYLFVT